VSPLVEALLDLARQRMGPAASAFVTAELRAIGKGRESLDAQGLHEIAARARGRSSRFMDEDGAQAFANAVELLAGTVGVRAAARPELVDHQLALDAAASLLARGDRRRAFIAYRDLARKHHDPPSLHGLARAAAASGDIAAATEALREAAIVLVQQGERDRAIAVLEDAVAIAPLDLASHRRLAALYANAGDVTSARCEHSRFAEACVAAGDRERALAEIAYARQTVGDAPALRDLEHRVEMDRAQSAAVAATVRRAAVTAITTPTAPPDDPELQTCRAAQDLLKAGKVRAASDLLLAYVAAGLPGRECQRLLVSVDRQLGRSDLAMEKCQLLSRLLELDGDRIGAVEIARQAVAS
jgi:tetratricopeptide (TPR) repeat protein